MSKFKKDAGIQLIKISYFLWSVILTLDSGFILWTIIKQSIKDAFSNTVADVVSSLIVLAYIIAVEGVLIFNIGKRFDAVAKGEAKLALGTYIALFIYLLLLSGINGVLSTYGRDYAAEVIIEHPTLPDASKRANDATEPMRDNVNNLKQQMASLEKQMKAAQSNVGTPGQRAAAKAGENWAIIRLNELRSWVAIPYQKQIAAVQNSLNEAAMSITNTVNTITTTAQAEQEMLLDTYTTSKNTVSGFMKWSAIVCLALMWITAALYAFVDASDGKLDGIIGSPNKKKDEDTNNDNATPRRAPKVNLNNKQPPVVEYFEAPISPTAQAAEIVFTHSDNDDNDNGSDNDGALVITKGYDEYGNFHQLRNFKFYHDGNNVITSAWTASGKLMDKTKCRLYKNIYASKARTVSDINDRKDNATISDYFANAMDQIRWPK